MLFLLGISLWFVGDHQKQYHSYTLSDYETNSGIGITKQRI